MRLRLVPEQPILRTLVWATLVSNIGNGLFIAISVLYFTRAARLTAAQVGLGLTVAGVCGVLAGVPAGRLADRWGARRTLVVLFCVETIGVLGYTTVRSMAAFLPLVCLVTFVDQGALTARSALIAVALPPDTRVYGRSVLRVVSNIGIGAGSAVAAIALQYDTRAAYQAMMLVDAATFLAAALLLIRLPVAAAGAASAGRPVEPADAGRRRPWHRLALVDRAYLLVTVLNGLLAVQVGVLEVGVPLWVVRSTHAPRFVISAVMVVNTLMVIFLQVRAGRVIDTPHQAARACRRAGVLLAVACVLLGLAHGAAGPLATGILLAGAVVLTLGEILSSAGGWALSFGLADPTNTGQYLGVFNSGVAAGRLLSPALITFTAIQFGMAGWLVLAAVFVTAGVGMPAVRLERLG